MDHDFALHVQLKAEVEGLHREPGERGQHEVVHDGCHDLTTHSVLRFCHVVVDKETEVKQEHGCHKLDENPCGCAGFGPPVGRDEQIIHILWDKTLCKLQTVCIYIHNRSFGHETVLRCKVKSNSPACACERPYKTGKRAGWRLFHFHGSQTMELLFDGLISLTKISWRYAVLCYSGRQLSS